MSAIEQFITGKSKSLIYWLQLFWGELFKKQERLDNSWKKIKIDHTYYPENMPKLARQEYLFNSCFKEGKKNTAIMEYIEQEYSKEFKTFKNYGTN